jgi:imidazolonepropionase-like amidohydrolase
MADEILTAPRVITGEQTLADGAVVVGQRTVDWVGPAAAVPEQYATRPQTDYPGATIMPGLIDSHVHLGFDGGPDPVGRMRAETDAQQLVLMLRSARELLGVGVTTARDLGARAYLDIVVRDAIADGLAPGPRMVVANSPVTVTGGHCWFMGGEADSEDDLRRIVRSHHKHGADLIKVMSTGGFMTGGSAPWYAQFSAEQLAIVVAEARRLDKPVAAHEHCSFVTEANERRFDEHLAAQIAERGIFVCPTTNVNAPYVAELTGRAVGENVKKMHDMGVRIIAGADAGINNTPHHQYPGGLAAMVTLLGFTPAQVITFATTEAAAALGLGSVTGRLLPGFEADLIVVDGDPQADITALGRLRRVIACGREYVPDSGRFDVGAPGSPYADPDRRAELRQRSEAARRRRGI